ncbi:MAG: hypothetical protein DI629_12395 [Mesorhizobium amorphae]|nr:MAG: hypothetical protein DI629_12395 [Mesorhizobium amorphae]
MGKIAVAILGAIIGGCAAVLAMVTWFGWGVAVRGQGPHVDPTRADYVDLLLTIVTVLLGAIGLAVTVGALVIGLVALKTLREIKEEARSDAKNAAAGQITETMAVELEPNVKAKVQEALPAALQAALVGEELGHKILSEMAQRGELDEVLERVAMRMQGGGPESDPDSIGQESGDEGESA